MTALSKEQLAEIRERAQWLMRSYGVAYQKQAEADVRALLRHIDSLAPAPAVPDSWDHACDTLLNDPACTGDLRVRALAVTGILRAVASQARMDAPVEASAGVEDIRKVTKAYYDQIHAQLDAAREEIARHISMNASLTADSEHWRNVIAARDARIAQLDGLLRRSAAELDAYCEHGICTTQGDALCKQIRTALALSSAEGKS